MTGNTRLPLLEVKNLKIEFPTRRGILVAVDDISLHIDAGEVLMVAITNTGPLTLGSTCCTIMATGWRPMTRAALTYSLFFSTMVELLTVRAN